MRKPAKSDPQESKIVTVRLRERQKFGLGRKRGNEGRERGKEKEQREINKQNFCCRLAVFPKSGLFSAAVSVDFLPKLPS